MTSASQEELETLQAELRRCRRCAEAGYPIQGPPVFWGNASARLMLVGQAPAEADLQHNSQPWSGPAGRRLMGWLARAGFEERSLRARAYLAALTRCYPGKASRGRGDRAPTSAERRLCAPYLAREIEILQPQLVIAIGQLAIAHFLGAGALSARIGEAYGPANGRPAPSAWILPLPHPSGANLWLNQPANQVLIERGLERLTELKAQLAL